MLYTTLGRTDIKISRICLGTMTWGLQNTEAQGHEQMDYAFEKGVNFWDTAEMYAVPPSPETYGKTEKIIGTWFAKNPEKRKDVVLATKFSPVPWARGEEAPVTNRENIIKAVEASLKRLQTDYIDLYQFHWPTSKPNYHFNNWWGFKPASGAPAKQEIVNNTLEILETCQELVQAGKIKHIGLSNDSAWGIKQFVDLAEQKNLPIIASIQNEYNLMRRRGESDVFEACGLEEVSHLAYSPLNMGVLSGKYLNGNMPSGSRFSPEVLKEQSDRFKWRMPEQAELAAKAYLEVAQKHNIDPCQMAIAFTIRESYMSSSIIGATTMEQLKSNIDAVDLILSDDILLDIDAVYRQYPIPF